MKYFLLFIFSLNIAHASAIDQRLQSQIAVFEVSAKKPRAIDKNRKLIELGQRLFVDTNLSGNKNISCMTCHDPMKGTSDGLSLSQTHDGLSILKRNSQGLFNLANNSSR